MLEEAHPGAWRRWRGSNRGTGCVARHRLQRGAVRDRTRSPFRAPPRPTPCPADRSSKRIPTCPNFTCRSGTLAAAESLRPWCARPARSHATCCDNSLYPCPQFPKTLSVPSLQKLTWTMPKGADTTDMVRQPRFCDAPAVFNLTPDVLPQFNGVDADASANNELDTANLPLRDRVLLSSDAKIAGFDVSKGDLSEGWCVCDPAPPRRSAPEMTCPPRRSSGARRAMPTFRSGMWRMASASRTWCLPRVCPIQIPRQRPQKGSSGARPPQFEGATEFNSNLHYWHLRPGTWIGSMVSSPTAHSRPAPSRSLPTASSKVRGSSRCNHLPENVYKA